MEVKKIQGLTPKKNWGFGGKTCKIWCDFIQLATLIANISETIQNKCIIIIIQIRKDKSSCDRILSGELWSTNFKVGHVSLDPPKSTFSGEPIGVLAPRIFTRGRDLPRVDSALYKRGQRPPKC